MVKPNLSQPVVFAGASIRAFNQQIHRTFDVRPPIRRGDLVAVFEQNQSSRPGIVIILDGIFGTKLAVPPGEIYQLLERGWRVFGASSIGALRAADCHCAGMIGMGHIYTGYALGRYTSENDVSTLYHSDDYAQLTYSLAQMDWCLSMLVRCVTPEKQSLISAFNRKMRAKYWAHRNIEFTLNLFRSTFGDTHTKLFEDCLAHPWMDIKVRDAAGLMNTLIQAGAARGCDLIHIPKTHDLIEEKITQSVGAK